MNTNKSKTRKMLSILIGVALVAQMGIIAMPAWADDQIQTVDEQPANNQAPATEAADGSDGPDSGEPTSTTTDTVIPDSQSDLQSGLDSGVLEDSGTDNGNDLEDTLTTSEEELSQLALQGDHISSLGTAVKPLASDTSWYSDGANSFTLTNVDQIEGFKNLVNSGKDFSAKTVKLGVTLQGWGIDPIGTSANPFNGTFDGNGFALNNHTVIPGDSKTNIGLFGYAGPDSVIKNVTLNNGSLTVNEQSSTGPQIQYVGAVVGYSKGKIDHVASSMAITITSNREAVANVAGNIREIGGIAGYLEGDLTNSVHSGSITISSPVNILENMKYVAGNVGGLVGAHGDATNVNNSAVISGSTNSGQITLSMTGSGGKDRFGEQMLSMSTNVGGIVGTTAGNISACTNSGIILTATGTVQEPDAGRGATNTGGIVGNFRGRSIDETATEVGMPGIDKDPAYVYYKDNGGVSGKPGSIPETKSIKDSHNSGTIVGLSVVGGIVGNTGSFTLIEGCGNTAEVKGCRWNKPFVGGIAGNAKSDIRYCYNQGDIYTVTGGGYYACGLAGSLTTVNTSATIDNERVPSIELTGCYVTGHIVASSAAYRSCVLVGETDAYIHANAYLPDLAVGTDNLVFVDNGTVTDNIKVTMAELKALQGNKGIAKTNTYASSIGGWGIYFVPDLANTNNGYPIVSRVSDPSTTGSTAIGSAASTPVLSADAIYSVSKDPVPKITVTPDTLLQNADYYVVPQSGTAGQIGGSYNATIKGMGKFNGALGTVGYGIAKADIGDCTVKVTTKKFNWAVQVPEKSWITVYDSSGATVDPSEYDLLPITPSASVTEVNKKFFDYLNCHNDTYKYDVTIKASAASTHYLGETTQAAFRIDYVDLNGKIDDVPQIKIDKLMLGDQVLTDNFQAAVDAKTESGINVTYTGSPIHPTVNSIKYLGQELRNGTGQNYAMNPTSYDYRYVYGNPNPEENTSTSTIDDNVTNATAPGSPAAVTIRYTNGGSFNSYINCFFNILPASLDNVQVPSTLPKQFAGSTPDVPMKYNGLTLKNGVDYDISYAYNTAANTAVATVTAKGNYTGTKTVSYETYPVLIFKGASRQDTAARVAVEAYPVGSAGVIIANGEGAGVTGKFPDALAASSLAGLLDYPILLTQPNSLPSYTADALAKLNPQNIILLGDAKSISENVVKALNKSNPGAKVTRLSGANRLETAYKIYEYGKDKNGGWGKTAIFADAGNFPDALAIAPYAGRSKFPIFLAQGNALSSSVAAALKADGFTDAIIVGSNKSVSDKIAAQIKSIIGKDATRLSGANRYKTAAAIARYSVDHGMSYEGAGIATAENFPDALAGGPLLAKRNAVLLLATDADSTVLDLLKGRSEVSKVHILGGDGAVSPKVRNTIADRLGWDRSKTK